MDGWTEEQDALLVKLAEHEVMHEGQIIRHLKGAELGVPETFVWA